MQTLNLKNHIELREKFGMINLTEFSLSEPLTDIDALIESFIRSDYYLWDSQVDHRRVKKTGFPVSYQSFQS